MLFPRLFGSGGNQNNNTQNNSQQQQSPSTEMQAAPIFQAPPPSGGFGSITLAPPSTQQQRTHHELPRLQIPPLSLIQPQQPQQPQLHWKAAAVEQPPAPPVSRMRMVANFFSSEARQQQQLQQQQQMQAPPSNGGMLPSFSEILARTKSLYHHPSQPLAITGDEDVAMGDDDMDEEDAGGRMSEESDYNFSMTGAHAHAPLGPNYAAARYALQPPVSIDTSSFAMDQDFDEGSMEAPSSPSGSMSPMSQSGKLSKRRERWTEDEHARFMEGLNRYGRKWKKIQGFVKTKTAVQVRTHAYGYFAKLLRNMPEDDAAWELAEEMSSLPGAVLKGPSSGKRRSEPKTDEAGMDILRRFVFSKKKTDAPAKTENGSSSVALEQISLAAPLQPQPLWGGAAPPPTQEGWNLMESQASSVMLDLKRQRIN